MKNNFSSTPANEVPHVTKFTVEESENKKSLLFPILIGIVLAIIIFFVVWILFLKKSPKDLVSYFKIKKDSSGQDTNIFKPEEANFMDPLNGVLFTESKASSWKDIRPLAVMVNNHLDARPQSGLEKADFIYEIVAEGGITRFLAFFLSDTPAKIGPVRSTREYYLTLVKELGDAALMHEGYSPQALEAIETWPVRSLQRGGAGCPWEGENEYCLRDNPRNVAVEHTAYAKGPGVRQKILELGWEGKDEEFQTWKFKDNKEKYSLMPSATNLTIDFWYKGDYSAIFKYDADKNSYLRFTGYDSENNPVPHMDQDTNNQLEAKNVVVQFVTETAIAGDDKNRLFYDFIGSGTGYVFLDGKVIEATWRKTDRDSRTIYFDKNGEEISFNRGKIWNSIVPDRNISQVVFN